MLIVIPARWASTRLPGKPLVLVGGQPLLKRVIDMVRRATRAMSSVDVLVAADDDRVACLARAMRCRVVMTDPMLPSGSDRVLAAALAQQPSSAKIMNVQGDAPFIPPEAIGRVIAALIDGASVATPVVQLSWSELDEIREQKTHSPFSGTFCARAPDDNAYWFSKHVLPAIRHEDRLRAASALSPVFQHVGLYGYTMKALKRFATAAPSHHEELEGLEQLRFFDLGIKVRTVDAGPRSAMMGGIDTPVDVRRAEHLLALHGDPFGT